MRAVIVLLSVGLAVATAPPKYHQKIVGGEATTINNHPYAAALLYSWSGATAHTQACGGTIINNRSILSAAHCFIYDPVDRWQIRLGSTYANSGGTVYYTNAIIIHDSYNIRTYDYDIAIMHSTTFFTYSDSINVARIAGPAYILPDNQAVKAIGWGATSFGGTASEELQEVEVLTVNHSTCTVRYAELGFTVTDNMLCSGWIDVGGRDQCQGDSGSPLLHDDVVIGVSSWGEECALARYPSINSRISSFTTWIQANA